MKKPAKFIVLLLFLSWAFICACGNCDDGDADNSNQNTQAIVTDSTYVK